MVGFQEDAEGRIWVAVNLGGLYVIEPASATVTPVELPAWALGKPPPPPPGGRLPPPGGGPPPGGRLAAFAAADDGQLWVGYGTGRLLPVNPTQPPVVGEPLSFPGVSIEAITVDQTQPDRTLLWLGTRSGLLRVEPASGQVQNFTERDGLPSSLIVGILVDRPGRLWLSTDQGLVRFDPTTGHFRTFDRTDGLPGNEFSPHAAWQAPTGRLFFGGSDGVTAFDPQAISDNRSTISVNANRLNNSVNAWPRSKNGNASVVNCMTTWARSWAT